MAGWSANQLIRWTDNGRLERILWVDPTGVGTYLIDIESDTALPTICKVRSLDLAKSEGRLDLEKNDPKINFPPESTLSQTQLKKRDRAWGIVLFLLKSQPEIFSEEGRGPLIRSAMEKYGVTKQTLYRWLRRYWQRGMTKGALIPDYSKCGAPGVDKPVTGKKRGRPPIYGQGRGLNVDAKIRRQFKSVITLEWAKNPRLNLDAAYLSFLEQYYGVSGVSDQTGRQTVMYLDDHPTMAQFRYWYERDNDPFKLDRARRTPRIYDMEMRPLLNTSTSEVFGPKSRYQIDATIADIYLVSRHDRNRIVGRPVLYVLIYVFSRMIVGVYAGFEGPSWVGAMMALVNTTADKVEYCRQYGLDIASEEWPCHDLPGKLLSDGGETAGKDIETLIEQFHVQLETASAYRGDWKGIVEQNFRTLQAHFSAYTPGYVQSDYRQRGGKDYRLDAELDIDQFTRIIIYCVLYHNNFHSIKNYDRDADMVADKVKPIPIELWEWGVRRRNGNNLQYSHEHVKLSLLPKDKATVTESGIQFWDCFYSCEKAMDDHWFESARKRGRWTVTISYDPRCMDAIFLHDHKEFIRCDLAPRSENFKSMSLWEIDQIRHLDQNIYANHGPKEKVGKINLRDHIEGVIDEAKSMKAQQPSAPMSNSAMTSGIQENRAAEKKALRRREAFVSGSPGPSDESQSSTDTPSDDDDDYKLPEVPPNILAFKRKAIDEENE